jgi:DNA-binding response OmpR family regulator
MMQLICFSEDRTLAAELHTSLHHHSPAITVFPASALSEAVRQQVQRISPDMIVLELTSGLGNAYMLFYLRAEQATRATPILVLTDETTTAHYASILGADAVLMLPTTKGQLGQTVSRLLRLPAAIEIGATLPIARPAQRAHLK